MNSYMDKQRKMGAVKDRCQFCGIKCYWSEVDQEWFHKVDPPRSMFQPHLPALPDRSTRNDGLDDAEKLGS